MMPAAGGTPLSLSRAALLTWKLGLQKPPPSLAAFGHGPSQLALFGVFI